MKNEFLTVAEASARIEAGDVMTVAGTLRCWRNCPQGAGLVAARFTL